MRSLGKSVTVVCVLFFLALCIVLSFTTYRIYTDAMLGRYQKQMTSILDYVEEHIDQDDMSECAMTFVESEKYKEFQAFFDELIDHYEDVHYLYIIRAMDSESPLIIRDICSANSTYEKLYEPDMVYHLGDGGEEGYDEETVREFLAIQNGTEDVFYINASQWGVDYTLVRPLVNSNGLHYGVLCADVSVDEINAEVYRNIYINITVIILSGIAFILFLLLWMRRNVVKPLKLLEESVADYASKSTGRRDPDELVYNAPELRVHNEVRSLSDAVTKLSGDMQVYVKNMIAAENESQGLKTQVFQDALTKVRNKAAYDKKVETLAQDILFDSAQFGMVMVDLDHLKEINDHYGHEHGNTYIVGGCKTVCDVFVHSPIYRIGGDEFIAVLQGTDYEKREALCECLKEQFRQSSENVGAEPWERYSASVGMSVYKAGDTVESVFKRADRAMYDEKSAKKK